MKGKDLEHIEYGQLMPFVETDGKEVIGLMILPEDAPIGVCIKEYLGLNKQVLDFEITSNRPDCLRLEFI